MRTQRVAAVRGRPRVAASLLGVAGCLAYLALATRRLDRPGLYYDELLFAHGAVGGDNPLEGFVARQVLDVPVMLMSYIGALKAWLYAPLLTFTAGTPVLLRLPMVVVGLAALLVVWRVSVLLTGRWLGALAVVMAATAQGFVWTTRLDWGPNALAALARTALLLAVVRMVGTRRAPWAVLALALMALGIFNKQDFLFSAVAVAVPAAACWWRALASAVREWTGLARAVVAVTASALIAETAVLVLPTASAADAGGAQTQFPLTHLWPAFRLYAVSQSGAAIHAFLTGLGTAYGPSLFLAVLPLLLAASALVVHVASRRGVPVGDPLRGARPVLFLLSAQAILVVGLASTRQATGPHHGIELWPTAALLSVASLRLLADALPSARSPAVALAVGAALLATAQGVVELPLARQLQDDIDSEAGLRGLLSTSIYGVGDVVREYGQAGVRVMSVDWGTGTQLLALACPGRRNDYADLWTAFGDPAAVPQAVSFYVTPDPGTIVISAVAPFEAPGLHGLPRLTAVFRRQHPDAVVQTLLRTRAWEVTWLGNEPARAGPAC